MPFATGLFVNFKPAESWLAQMPKLRRYAGMRVASSLMDFVQRKPSARFHHIKHALNLAGEAFFVMFLFVHRAVKVAAED